MDQLYSTNIHTHIQYETSKIGSTFANYNIKITIMNSRMT